MRVPIQPQQFQEFLVILMANMGLGPGATLAINVTNLLPTNGTALVILTNQQLTHWLQHPPPPLPGGGYSSYLVSYWRQPFCETLVMRHRISAPRANQYYVGVLNVHREVLMLKGALEFENPGGQHLPLQQVYLPEALWASSAAFGGLTLAVVMLMSFAWLRGANFLHGLLILCLWMKSAELAFKYRYFDLLARHGVAPAWRLQAWKLVTELHDIGEVLLLLLTALGWRVVRPRLSRLEFRCTLFGVCLAAFVVVMQALSAIQTGSSEPMLSFTLFFYIARIAAWMVIIFAMNFNLQLIGIHLEESPVSMAIARLYQKQQTYLWFRRLFVAIVLRPSAVVWLQVSVFGADGGDWVVTAFAEASSWALYVGLFATLRPPGPAWRLLDLMRAMLDTGPEPASPPAVQGSGGPWATPALAGAEGLPTPAARPMLLPASVALPPLPEAGEDGLATPYVPLMGDG